MAGVAVTTNRCLETFAEEALTGDFMGLMVRNKNGRQVCLRLCRDITRPVGGASIRPLLRHKAAFFMFL